MSFTGQFRSLYTARTNKRLFSIILQVFLTQSFAGKPIILRSRRINKGIRTGGMNKRNYNSCLSFRNHFSPTEIKSFICIFFLFHQDVLMQNSLSLSLEVYPTRE